MDYFTMSVKTILYLLLGLVNLSTSQVSDIKDFCAVESFNVTCPKDHVILMMHALYGRMKKGRCIEGEGGYLGCSSNVIATFDAKCSGRPTCAVPVHEFLSMEPCNKDFQSYLEAAYECITVHKAPREGCSKNHGVPVEGPDGFIMHTRETTVGNNNNHHGLSIHRTPGVEACPWNIKVKDGQKINLTVMTFGDPKGMKICNAKLKITDGGVFKEVPLCGERLGRSSHARERHIYTSQHSQVSAFISQSYRGYTDPKYMLHYQAVGCANMTVPAPNWAVRRDAGTLKVTCNSTGEIWFLICSGSTWVGDIGNCTKGSTESSTHNNVRRKSSATVIYHGKLGIIFAVLIGIVLGVTIGALLLLLVHCYKRKQKQSQHNNFVMVPQDAKDKFYEEGTYKPMALDPKSGQLKDAYPALLRDTGEPYETRTQAGHNHPHQQHLQQQGVPHKQCYSVENHNMQIKTFPHDRTLYHSLDTKCGDCACPNSGNNRCDVTGSRYIDVE